MLNSFRSSKSNVFFWIIIALLIIGLAGFGVGSSGAGGGATPVARVGDHEVSVDEYVQALNSEQQQFFSAYGRAPNARELSDIGRRTLSQLLSGAAFDGEAERLGISISDDRVREDLMATRAFSDTSGQFDRMSYEFALENAGLSASEYDEIVRSTSTRRLVETGIGGGVAYGETAGASLVSFLSEKRGVSWVRIGEAALTEEIPAPSDADLETHHADNADAYTLPERRAITYASVTQDALIDTMDIPLGELEELYEERMDIFSRPERRLVDRIVFADTAAAAEALARIQAGDAGFDDIAVERGLDPADTDLGEVERDDLNSDTASLLFGSDTIGVVGPVTTDLGPALFRVNAALDATQTPFEDARDELRDELGRDRADGLIAEEITVIEDLLAGGATIEEVAEETLLELGTIELGPDTFEGIAADAGFREEALDADVGEFRELADLSDGVFVLRVDEIRAPELQALESVRETVVADWQAAQTQAAAEAIAEDVLAALQEGQTLGAVASERGLIVTEEDPLDRRGIVEGTRPNFVASLFETETGAPFLVTDDAGAIVAVVGDVEAADLQSEGLANAVTLATQELQSGVTDDVLTLYARAVQDAGGVETNLTLIQQIHQQLFGELQ